MREREQPFGPRPVLQRLLGFVQNSSELGVESVAAERRFCHGAGLAPGPWFWLNGAIPASFPPSIGSVTPVI
jgi:hypothetical protein